MPLHKILQGDAIQQLNTLPSNSINLILADLPYGTTQNKWDSVIPFDQLWPALRRVCRPEAAIVLTATQPFASQLISSAPNQFRYDLIWSKNKSTGFLNAKRQPLRSHEHILIFCRQAPPYNPQMTNGHRPGNKARRTVSSTNYGAQTPTDYGGQTERYPVSVLSVPIINNDDADKFHPTQKPVDLMRYLIRTYSNPGEIVLDPTMGSGTTGVAALLENRSFVGIELNPDYCEIARQRIAQLSP